MGIVAPSVTRKNDLRDVVQQPARAKSFLHIVDALNKWEADTLAFLKAGGLEPIEEERKAQLMKILQSNGSDWMELLGKADEFTNSAELEAWMRKKGKFMQEHSGGKEAHANAAEQE